MPQSKIQRTCVCPEITFTRLPWSRGLFCSLYTDRGSHYWHTPEAGGKVDKVNLTQVGRAMKPLGIEMIPAYSPESQGA